MTRTNIALLVLIACVATLPLFGDAYALRLGTMACMYAIFALSWNIVGGFAGYPSLRRPPSSGSAPTRPAFS